MAEPLAGALLAGAQWRDTGPVAVLLLASGCLYAGGAALNDWHGFKHDSAEQAERDRPAARVGRSRVLLLAVALLVAGVLLAALTGFAPLRVALILAAVIVLYNLPFRDMPFALALLAGCRVLNLLLGMSLATSSSALDDWSLRVYLLAAMGIYGLGLAVFAEKDSVIGLSSRLLAGSITTWAGILAIVLLRVVFPNETAGRVGLVWASLLMLAVGYRMIQALLTPDQTHLQRAVDTATAGLILLNASMVAFATGPLSSLAVAAFLAPLVWLQRLVPHAHYR